MNKFYLGKLAERNGDNARRAHDLEAVGGFDEKARAATKRSKDSVIHNTQ